MSSKNDQKERFRSSVEKTIYANLTTFKHLNKFSTLLFTHDRYDTVWYSILMEWNWSGEWITSVFLLVHSRSNYIIFAV